MRSELGTRIELCFVFVRIKVSFGWREPNFWPTPRQLRQGASSTRDTDFFGRSEPLLVSRPMIASVQ
eukprot:813133-Prymnesium_polylepis.1